MERYRSSQTTFSSRSSSDESLVPKNLRMHTDDQHLFIVGTIEDTASPSLWKPACRAPEKVVFQLLRAGLLKAVDVAAFRVDP
jgi:hypothetical protein